ncbi:hypothetical protein N7493_006974 [Penicillium malachiteum]|uniref:Uncharacterized protein n=1 Tax=Penicillium malachiteum TaxID=1324776 RepID=A0AAD6HJQ4_9EURO|nr:hypothetical protein N7493_006974 [Penicillium malachiteum]
MLDLPHMKTAEKRKVLQAAIHNGDVSLKSILCFLRNKWPMHLDQRRQKDRNKRQKKTNLQKNLERSAKPRENTRRTTLAMPMGENPTSEDVTTGRDFSLP